MKTNNFGFTLIELLTAVLILGILTSVALPQYRRSVQRAEAMEAMVNIKALFDSAKRYRSANSAAPTKLNGLDISFFDADNDNSSTFHMGKYTYTFYNDRISSCRGDTNSSYCFTIYYKHDTLGRDTMTCTSRGSGKYSWLCEAIAYTPLCGAEGSCGTEYNMSKE